MSELRQAAEMALEFVEWLCSDDHSVKPKNNALKTREALRQALDDRPPVKTYAGGKPNYTTPEETPEVDEAAKGEHETLYMDMSQVPTGMPDWKPGMVFPAPKREWVGLTDEEIKDIIFADDPEFGLKTYSASDWAKIKRTENLLREKNVPQP